MEVKRSSNEHKIKQSLEENILLPEQIVSGLNLTWPTEQVTVKGTVTRISRPYPADSPRWIYGDLAGDSVTITYHCPLSHAPKTEGEKIIFKGYIRIKPSSIHDGLQIEIDGTPIGTWHSEYENEKFFRTERTHDRLNLNAFVRQYSLEKLLVLSTSRGQSDYKAPMSNAGIEERCSGVVCNFSQPKKLFVDISNAVKKYDPSGLVFIRGGSDSGKTLRMWDDAELISKLLEFKLPIYSAIGHSDKLMLIDKYADESFTSPTDFGHRLAHAITSYKNECDLQEENERLDRDHEALQRDINSHSVNIKGMKSYYRKWIVALSLTVVALALLIAGSISGLF